MTLALNPQPPLFWARPQTTPILDRQGRRSIRHALSMTAWPLIRHILIEVYRLFFLCPSYGPRSLIKHDFETQAAAPERRQPTRREYPKVGA